MRLLLVSDTHGNNEALDRLSNMYPNMDFYLHLGDSESDEWSIRPFISVRGNNDYGSSFESFLVIPTPMGNIFACHHNRISRSELSVHNAKFFIHGHTHTRKHEIIDRIIEINPGAISFARDTHDLSYAILEITSENYSLTFFSL